MHLLAEATKAAYRVRDDFIADPAQVAVDVAGFLSDDWAERSARRRSASIARCPARALGRRSSTRTRSISAPSIATATPCSFINSLFSAFGSGIIAPGKRRDAAQPRQRLPHDPRPSQRDRAGQAAVSHDHPGACWSRTAAR